MRRFVVIAVLGGLSICAGCKFPPPKSPPPPPPKVETQLDYSKIDMTEVVEVIKGRPKWLQIPEVCISELIPADIISDDYDEYKCGRDLAACLDKCRSEDGSSCYSLALLLQRTKGLQQNYSEQLFSLSCRLGTISACTNRAAGKLNLEKNRPEDIKCIADTFEKTCSLKDPWGCTMYGLVLWEGRGRRKSSKDALIYLERACGYTSEDDKACKRAREIKQRIVHENNKNR